MSQKYLLESGAADRIRSSWVEQQPEPTLPERIVRRATLQSRLETRTVRLRAETSISRLETLSMEMGEGLLQPVEKRGRCNRAELHC